MPLTAESKPTDTLNKYIHPIIEHTKQQELKISDNTAHLLGMPSTTYRTKQLRQALKAEPDFPTKQQKVTLFSRRPRLKGKTA